MEIGDTRRGFGELYLHSGEISVWVYEKVMSSWMPHFDKLLLGGLFLFLLFFNLVLILLKVDQESIAWAQSMSGPVLGALLTLITGRLFQRSSDGTDTRSLNGKTGVATIESSNQPLPPVSTQKTTVTETVTTDPPAQPELPKENS